MTDQLPVHDALVLAGGRGSRLGGVDKAMVPVAGRALIDHVLDAVHGAHHVVLVGPGHLARPGVPAVLEEPASGGPVAGIAAGLTQLATRGSHEVPVLVLACDVPRAAAAVPGLLAALAAHPEVDGAHLVSADGHPQTLVAVYRGATLRRAVAQVEADGGVRGASVRRLVRGLRMHPVPDPEGLSQDADTWDDVSRLEAAISRRSTVDDHTHEPVGSDLHRWWVGVAEELGVEPDAVDVETLLDLSREVANGVARPAVPVTSFLVGYAVAVSGGDRAALDRVVTQTGALVREWVAREGGQA
ncbi:NTP transferase domain-containing protein [Actinotalea sp. K2]|uniref:NTP transferase domain-containing protein n=1 Tax=Actinotalea sp. K2 TaxID=2939438 RepID=UPI00201798F2|nr:NTP transferase domain-containing protein [Actinotalea sp. K2]MCL3862776.1 molybdenum cofactor guanylyltransferase [Actinotalea sp. K2]